MRLERTLWVAVAIYFAVIAVAYAASGGSIEGVVILLGGAAFGGLVAGWTWHWTRTNPLRPSDSDDVVDEPVDVGVFPASSLRPLGVAVAMCAIVVGVAVGSWLLAAGLAMLASQVALIVRDTDG